MPRKPHEAMFSPAVRAAQRRLGSSDVIEHQVQRQRWKNRLTNVQMEFIQASDSMYMGTASLDGQPYIQHRGGPPGFVQVESASQLWFLDFAGNLQYISVGNVSENPLGFLFFMDYRAQRRLKLWGRLSLDENIRGARALLPTDYPAEIERKIIFDIDAIDENCPSHIKPR